MSVIYIKDLVVEGKHGIHPHEKATAQHFSISVELTVNTSKAALSDGLADTVDWSKLRDMITDTVQNESFNLVERLAQQLADRILADRRVEKLTLSIDKLDAFGNGLPGIRIGTAGRSAG
jgi:dihydroneopterin aldolase